jgi:hypothetical protein
MKIYMAAKFSRRKELELLSELLKDVGHVCNARWVFGGEEGLSSEQIADVDVNDVIDADAIMCFTHERGTPQPGGGRHVEFGIALSRNKRLILIGPRENVFHHYPGVEVYESVSDFIQAERDWNMK